MILQPGDKVRYCPTRGKEENGIVKCLASSERHVFVVYHCDNDWDNYENFTSALTDVTDLKIGWED